VDLEEAGEVPEEEEGSEVVGEDLPEGEEDPEEEEAGEASSHTIPLFLYI